MHGQGSAHQVSSPTLGLCSITATAYVRISGISWFSFTRSYAPSLGTLQRFLYLWYPLTGNACTILAPHVMINWMIMVFKFSFQSKKNHCNLTNVSPAIILNYVYGISNFGARLSVDIFLPGAYLQTITYHISGNFWAWKILSFQAFYFKSWAGDFSETSVLELSFLRDHGVFEDFENKLLPSKISNYKV